MVASRICLRLGMSLSGNIFGRFGNRFFDLREDVDHADGSFGGFSAAIHAGGNAAGMGLFFILDEQDFVNDWNAVADGEILK